MWEFLDRYWVKFINGYCKVDFLCYNGNPNWLGWIPIGFIGLFCFCFCIGFCGWVYRMDKEEREMEELHKKYIKRVFKREN